MCVWNGGGEEEIQSQTKKSPNASRERIEKFIFSLCTKEKKIHIQKKKKQQAKEEEEKQSKEMK
jgi:hypothetical protein